MVHNLVVNTGMDIAFNQKQHGGLLTGTGVDCKTNADIVRQRRIDDDKIKSFLCKYPFGGADTGSGVNRGISCFGEQVCKGRGETICCRHNEYTVNPFS